jgi:hypothetical protein
VWVLAGKATPDSNRSVQITIFDEQHPPTIDSARARLRALAVRALSRL